MSQISEVLTFCTVLQNRLLVKLKLILNHRHRSSIPESGCGLVQAQRTAVFSHCRIYMLAFPSWLHHVVYMCMSVSPTLPKNVHKLSHPDETTCKQVLFRQQAVTDITYTCKQVLFWQQAVTDITYTCKQVLFRQQAVTAITYTCKQVLFWQQVIMGITYACKQAIFQQQAVMGK